MNVIHDPDREGRRPATGPSGREAAISAGERARRLRSAAERLAGRLMASPSDTAAGDAPGADDAEGLARACLICLGQEDHPDALDNPVQALYQVAVDFRCAAEGYRNLYEHARAELAGLKRSLTPGPS